MNIAPADSESAITATLLLSVAISHALTSNKTEPAIMRAVRIFLFEAAVISDVSNKRK